MAADNAALLPLAVAISDGHAVDWDEAERSAEDEGQRELIRELRLVANIGEVHRSTQERGDPLGTAPTEPEVGLMISHYRLACKLGEGAMGVVWKAEDMVLGRSVAIKFLPGLLARHPQQLARFEREARVLASLNHPNIAAIHGLEKANGTRFLVLELVSGQTLAERRASGRLAVEESLDICRQIAEAMESAHERGIIHRDLKPANIKITPEGKVKVLDFGLAKALAGETVPGEELHSPTSSSTETRPGVVLGTPAYSSPEQACGQPLDRRTDIWSFGCVFYELLANRSAFARSTISDTVAAVLKGEADWQALPSTTPGTVRTLLRRCLQKDANRRLRDIGDARIEIEEALDPSVADAATFGAPARWSGFAAWILVGVVLGALAAGTTVWNLTRHGPAPSKTLTRFTVTRPPSLTPISWGGTTMALSPDGTGLVFGAATTSDGSWQLYYRAMDKVEVQAIAGTENGEMPFFSPDGQWLGFVNDGKLKKVRVIGGTPVTLTEASDRGASWAEDGMIYFTPNGRSGLWRIRADGGDPEVATVLDAGREEITHRFPQILPGGKAVLFTVGLASCESYDDAPVAVQHLETSERKILLESGTNARYVPTGHLVYARAGGLLAVPFDLDRLEITGPAVPVLQDVVTSAATGLAVFAVSESGSLAYVPGSGYGDNRSLLSVDLDGNARMMAKELRPYASTPDVSPDGQRIAIGLNLFWDDVWIYEMARGTLSRLTSVPGNDARPVWTPDGKRVAFVSDRNGQRNVFWIPFDASEPAEQLLKNDYQNHAASWTADGKVLALDERHPVTGWDIWLLSLDGERKPQPFLRTEADEYQARFSPDGRWIAYTSNDSGREEIYLQSYPKKRARHRISTSGGIDPKWSPDGKTLYYRWDALHAVSIETGPEFAAGEPRIVLRGQEDLGAPIWGYDVRPDGRGFIVVRSELELETQPIHVLVNWADQLTRIAPAGGQAES